VSFGSAGSAASLFFLFWDAGTWPSLRRGDPQCPQNCSSPTS